MSEKQGKKILLICCFIIIASLIMVSYLNLQPPPEQKIIKLISLSQFSLPDLAINISRNNFKNSRKIILTSNANPGDIILGLNLSSSHHLPLLILNTIDSQKTNDSLNNIKNEIKRMQSKEIILIQTGKNKYQEIVSLLQKNLKISAKNIQGLSGDNLIETSTIVSQEIGGREVVITTEKISTSSLLSCYFAILKGAPLLFMPRPFSSSPEAVDPLIQDYLKKSSAKSVILIGSDELLHPECFKWMRENNYSLESISKKNNYQFAQELAERAAPAKSIEEIILSLKTEDRLLGAIFYGHTKKIPLLLTNESSLSLESAHWINSRFINSIYIWGNTQQITSSVESQLENINTGNNIKLRYLGKNGIETNQISDTLKLNDFVLERNKLGTYYSNIYNDLLSTRIRIKLDRNGIITSAGGKKDYYSPILISQYGISNFNAFERTRDEKYRKTFLNQANWLVNHQKSVSKKMGIWEFPVSEEHYGAKAPWISSMAQGEAISVLTRAYQTTGDEKYIQSAKKALNAFTHDIKDGGVSSSQYGLLFFEEVAVTPSPHILNGFIFSLWGPYDYYLATGDGEALQLYKDGLRTLILALPLYHTIDGSRYDLRLRIRPSMASLDYQGIHILQLRALYKQTGFETFLKYADKWDVIYIY